MQIVTSKKCLFQDDDEISTAKSKERYASEVVETDGAKAEAFSMEVTTIREPTRAELKTVTNEAKTRLTAPAAVIANTLAALKATVRAECPFLFLDDDEMSTAKSKERYASEEVETDGAKAEEYSMEVRTTGNEDIAPSRAELRSVTNEAKTRLTAHAALIANTLAALKATVRAARQVSDTSAIIVAETVPQPEGSDILEEILNNDGDDDDIDNADYDVDEDNIEILYRR